MKNFYQTNHLITISEVDVNYKLRLDNILNFLQDLTTYHSYELKVDRESICNASNAFWVLTKMKLSINSLPKWNEEITLKTWPTKVTPIRFFREYAISLNNSNLINCKSEWCVLDATTKAIRKSSSINYPVDMEHLPENKEIPDFLRLKQDIDEGDYVYSYQVNYTDLDCNEHTNNVVYSKLSLNALTLNEIKNLTLKGFEIHFLNQSYYKDNIKIYKKVCDEGIYVEGRSDDKKIFVSLLTNK